ncbi:MAG TPA: response regulator [Kiritimatiellia bacterium]|nr:response regulator [Kiritimatiellia bacterium]HQQ04940.1 response regulator [Kiritimatiellia bacterium]
MKTILIADDIEANRYLLQSLLKGSGYKVSTTQNGREALDAARKNPPDMIITDILMPEMDGFQLCRAWRTDKALAGIPFIFYTATYTDPSDEKFALDLGADRFITKPQSPETLLQAIQAVFEETETKGVHAAASGVSTGDQYSQVLFKKLEQKVQDLEETRGKLEKEIRDRQQAEDERIQLERQLRQAKKMEALGALSSGVAHDFNNILQGITGYAELALDALPDAPQEARDYLGEIIRAGGRASELIRQIMTFSREVKVGRTPCLLEAVVREAINLMRGKMPPRVVMDADIISGGPHALVDAGQIHQIITNLISNAFDAMREGGGHVQVSYYEEDVDEHKAVQAPRLKPGRYAVLQVADTGPGMDPATLERIFEPYFTTKAAHGGTGLGLAVVHGILETHGASISVESRPGLGTTFTIYFPACQLRDNGRDVGPELRGSESILLVCRLNEQSNGNPGMALGGLGYQVRPCSGEAALQEVRSEQSGPAAVLIDCCTPGINPASLTAQFKQMAPELPVVMYYSAPVKPGEESDIPLGIHFVADQPASLKDLAAEIRALLA